MELPGKTGVYIKEELDLENNLAIPNNVTTREPAEMEFSDEKPAIQEVLFKVENIEEPLPADRQEFLFVACADPLTLNESNTNNQNLSTTTRIAQPRAAQKGTKEICPYCELFYLHVHMHKNKCPMKFAYWCTFCPSVLTQKTILQTHISNIHQDQLKNTSLTKIVRDIIAKKKELHIETVEEKRQAIIEMINKNAQMQSTPNEVFVVTRNQEELIVPDLIETHDENSTPDEDKTHEAPSFSLVVRKLNAVDKSTSQKSKVMNSRAKTRKKNQSVKTPKVAKSSTKTSKKNQSVKTRKKKGTTYVRKRICCNECPYTCYDKQRLKSHISRQHWDQLNLRCHECSRCKENFQVHKLLLAHVATCKKQLCFPCPYCDKKLWYHSHMTRHLLALHHEKIKDMDANEISHLVESKKIYIEKVIERKVTAKKQKLIEPKVESMDTMEQELSVPSTKKRKGRYKREADYIFCEHCRFKTLIKMYMVDHMRKRHSEELNLKIDYVSCPKCKKRVVQLNLDSHLKECGMIFKYPCVFCSTVVKRMDTIKCHIKSFHSSELSNKSIDDVLEDVRSKKIQVIDDGNKVVTSKKKRKRTESEKRDRREKRPRREEKPKSEKVEGASEKSIVKRKRKYKYPDVDPYKIDASNFDHVIIYCFKCKKLKSGYSNRNLRIRYCEDCDTRIIYICIKCKEFHTVEFDLLNKHWKVCSKLGKISEEILDEFAVHSCADCTFKGTHKGKFFWHLARMKHKAADAVNADDTKNIDLDAYDEAKFVVRPCVVDFATMTQRYCKKCDKVVTDEMQKRVHQTEGSCEVCGTSFIPQCVVCNIKCEKYIVMRYHLTNKCFAGEYLCIKCDHRTTSWQLMQKHYLFNHTDRMPDLLCEFCSFKTKHRTNFWTHMKRVHPDKQFNAPANHKCYRNEIDLYCAHCSFVSKHKYCLKIHLQNVHNTKRHKCKLCKFKTKYEANLRRHILTRHKNHY